MEHLETRLPPVGYWLKTAWVLSKEHLASGPVFDSTMRWPRNDFHHCSRGFTCDSYGLRRLLSRNSIFWSLVSRATLIVMVCASSITIGGTLGGTLSSRKPALSMIPPSAFQ